MLGCFAAYYWGSDVTSGSVDDIHGSFHAWIINDEVIHDPFGWV